MFMRMARIQVYLPDDLYTLVKERGLHASRLLQEAVRAEARRLQLLEEAERFLDELVDEVGAPTPEETARANAIVQRLERRIERRAG
jgi:post-segregation antitoxin (ccd killing protein)